MSLLRYSVAMSLDGFIAGPRGEYDWITPDSSFDFAALWSQFDTLLMGRKTYEIAVSRLDFLYSMGKKVVVVSTTLNPAKHPRITILSSAVPETVSKLKAQPASNPAKDIWLMGGGVLFRTLLDAGLVDTVELSVLPVLLGSGIPLLPEGRRSLLHLGECKTLPSGMLVLKYLVNPDSQRPGSNQPRTRTPEPKRRKP